MASSSTELDTALADEDQQQDGRDKKKKLKPFEAVRKFFKSTRKRKGKDDSQVSIVSVKAKSTTALHSGSKSIEDEEDEGGFKPNILKGTRSISEDSVFNPELKEPNPESLKKSAVSEENIPKSTFQKELVAKLKNRQSVYSDDEDTDAGLPHSPTPPIETTADIIMSGGLKPLPASGKSMSRESETSLISEDVSDNDEDDAFNRDWKKSVASVSVPKTGTSLSKDDSILIDLSSVQSTQVLSNKLSKDKLSIKPNRKARQSRKKKEERTTSVLPGLKEESPTKLHSDVTFPDAPAAEKLSKSLPSKFNEESFVDKTTLDSPDVKVITAPLPATTKPSFPTKVETIPVVNISENVAKASSVTDTEKTNSENKNELSKVFTKLKKTSSEEKEEKIESKQKLVETKDIGKDGNEHRAKSGSVSDVESVKDNVDSGSETKVSSEPKKSTPSLRATDSNDSMTTSPKEEYRLRRQNRSKTLPVAAELIKEEAPAPTVSIQRANSQRTEPDVSPKPLVAKRQSVVLPLSSNTRPSDSKRLSWVEQPKAVTSPSEPDWLANLRKKKASEKEDKSPEETKTADVQAAEKPVERKKSVGETKAPIVTAKSNLPSKTAETKPVEITSQVKKASSVLEKQSSTGDGEKPTTPTTTAIVTEPVGKPETSVKSLVTSSNSIASRINSLKGVSSSSSKAEDKCVTGGMPKTASIPLTSKNTSSITTSSSTSSHTVTKPTVTAVSKPTVTPISTKSVVASKFTGPVTSPTKTTSTAVTTKIPDSSKQQVSNTTSKPSISSTKPSIVSKPLTSTKSAPVSSFPNKVTTSPLKEAQPNISTSSSSSSSEPRKMTSQKKTDNGVTSSNIMAPIKIELIENSAPLPKPEKKTEQKVQSSVKLRTPTDKVQDANSRKSVLDMVQKFQQKLEVS